MRRSPFSKKDAAQMTNTGSKKKTANYCVLMLFDAFCIFLHPFTISISYCSILFSKVAGSGSIAAADSASLHVLHILKSDVDQTHPKVGCLEQCRKQEALLGWKNHKKSIRVCNASQIKSTIKNTDVEPKSSKASDQDYNKFTQIHIKKQ